MQIIVDELTRGPGEVRRRSPHRDHRRRIRRAEHRGSDCRRRHGDHGQQHRLHQADGDLDLSQSAARRQGPHRHADPRRRLRRPPVRRLDPRLHHDLLGPRPRLLAEGPRGARRRPRRQGQGDRQPGVDGRGRADRRDAGGQGIRGRQVRRDGLAQGRDQEDGAVGVQQSRAPAASSRWASSRTTRSSRCR